MKKLSVMVDNLNRSQLSIALITSFNEISQSPEDLDVMAFYRNPAIPPITPLFASMSDAEIWGYDGNVMATNLKTAKSLIDVTGPNKKYFYIWDLEWLRMRDFYYDDISDIYTSDELNLVVRSEHHYDLVSKCWKEPSLIMENFDAKTLIDISGEV